MPEETDRSFIRLSRAWYADANLRGRTDGLVDDICVQGPEIDDVVVEQNQHGGLWLSVSEDGFDGLRSSTFRDVAESLGAARREHGKRITLDHVEEQLTARGFSDATLTESPYAGAEAPDGTFGRPRSLPAGETAASALDL